MVNKSKITSVYQQARNEGGLDSYWLLGGKLSHYVKFLYVSVALLLPGERGYFGIFIQSQATNMTPWARVLHLRATLECPTQKEGQSTSVSKQRIYKSAINSSMNNRKILANSLLKNIPFRRHDKEEYIVEGGFF